jgi:hypothetical protein
MGQKAAVLKVECPIFVSPSHPRVPPFVFFSAGMIPSISAIRALAYDLTSQQPFVLSVVLARARAIFRLTQTKTITFPILQPVKARCVIDEQLSLALLADIISFEEDI